MKKYLLGLFAIVFAITLNSFTTNFKSNSKPATTDWYPVDQTTQLTTSATPVVSNLDKTGAIGAQPCNDMASLYCLVGADSPPAVGTAASSFDNNHRIKKN